MCSSSLDIEFFVRSGLKRIRLFQSVIFLTNSNMKNPWSTSASEQGLLLLSQMSGWLYKLPKSGAIYLTKNDVQLNPTILRTKNYIRVL